MDKLQAYQKYAQGIGIEIGALCFPWSMHHDVSIRFIDRKRPLSGLIQNYEPVQFLMAESPLFTKMESESNDFLFSSHVLEHSEEVISSVRNWLRILKRGGHLLIAMKDSESYHRRPVTGWEHLLEEYLFKEKIEQNRREHFIEYFTSSCALERASLDAAIEAALKTEIRIHFHSFTKNSAINFTETLHSVYGGFSIQEMLFASHEVFIVLRKEVEGNPKW